MRLKRTATLATATLCVGLLTVGCSSSEPTTTSDSNPSTAASAGTSAASGSMDGVVKQAAQTTADAQSAKMQGDVTVTGGGADTSMKLDALVDFNSGDLDGSLTADVFGQTQDMKFRLVDGKTYVQMEMFGDKWIAAPTGTDLPATSDPLAQLDSLKDVSDLQEVGTEDVNGVSATHYTGTIDLAKALKASGLPDDQVEAAEKALGKGGSSAKIDIWVDDSDRIVKVNQTLDMSVGDKGDASVTTSMTFSDFGTDVNVEAPDPADVLDAGKLANLSQGGQSPQG